MNVMTPDYTRAAQPAAPADYLAGQTAKDTPRPLACPDLPPMAGYFDSSGAIRASFPMAPPAPAWALSAK